MPFKQSDAGSTPAGSTNLCHCQNGFNSLYSVATGEVSGNDIEFIIMKKTKQVKKVKGNTPDEIAKTYKDIFDALIRKGFTTDQSMQLILSMCKS